LIAAPIEYAMPVKVTIGSELAQVSYAGLVAAGEYQLNVVVPGDLAAGNYPITISAGQASPGNIILPVQ
jgi:uncharacterized protein (TIGR03437 family)